VRYASRFAAACVALGRGAPDPPFSQHAARAARPAIKDNEIRVEYMGASVRYAIHVNYVIAATLAGGAGRSSRRTVGHIDPEMAYWTTSGEFVFNRDSRGHREA